MHILAHRFSTIHIPRLAFFLVVISASACRQPEDTRTGFQLSGEAVEGIVDDWSFTDDIQEIFIQTKTWYLLPHSATIWCAEVDGELYIGAYEETKRWETNVEGNPAARLRIGGKLYDVSVTPITDAQAISEIDVKYHDKYVMERSFGDNVPQWRYYAVSQLN